jgi:hypothetical protein
MTKFIRIRSDLIISTDNIKFIRKGFGEFIQIYYDGLMEPIDYAVDDVHEALDNIATQLNLLDVEKPNDN